MQGGPLPKKYKIYLDPVGVAHVRESYEERLSEIFPKSFKHLHLCALDPYDLALSKLERNIQRDFEPKYEEFQSRTIWSLSNAFTSAFPRAQ